MAKTGLTLHVGQYERGVLARPWFEHYRPKPANLVLVPEGQWRADLMAGRYDVVIAHNENNALDVRKASVPKLLVCHNRRSFLATTAKTDRGDPAESFWKLIGCLREWFAFIFISESKRADYGIPGRVIPPGIDIEEYGGYTGEEACVLRVGNMMRDRNLMFDVDFQERVVAGLPHRVIGENPGIPDSMPARSFDELRAYYRRSRCLLHVTREAYEDGYNLVTLEAMATGLPIVALANPTSPLTDGVDGFVSYDAAVLRDRIEALLRDRELAREIGARGRETVARKFPLEAFVERWRAAIFEAADQGAKRFGGPQATAAAAATPRMNILLHYMASPITTGRYFDEALRENHNVLTAGYRVPEDVLALWGFPAPTPPYLPHAVNLALEASWADVAAGLPEGYAPDLYLWVDSGPKAAPEGLEALDAPKIAYLIDSHIAPELRLAMARPFDCVFLAQKGQVESFREAGIRHVFWVPLACSPALHNVASRARALDVAYVGSFSTEEDARRPRLLEAVRARFPDCFIGKAWPEDMAGIYAGAKIVVNACVNRDVNMRVFEGMASGALVITDEADGLEDLFQDRKHLVVYRNDDELLDLIAYYLEHEDERARIAETGLACVLGEHTYSHRVREILDTTRAVLGALGREDADFELGEYYECPRPELLPFIPLHARRVLDVGCGAGAFGWLLKRQRRNITVSGLEVVEHAAEKARRVLDGVIVGSIETMDLPFEDGRFDCIVCADVLEHLVDPAAALRKLARVLAPDGVIVISIPNVRYYAVIESLSLGRWQYMDRGILDRTHLRFFTRVELEGLVRDAGLELCELAPLSMGREDLLPLGPDGSVRMGKITIEGVSDAEYADLRTYQYRVIAGHPGADRLARARAALEQGHAEVAAALALHAAGVDECERRRVAAKALARAGQLTRAEELLREAAAIRPEDATVAGELGILLVGMNRAGAARPLLERAVAAHPEDARALGALGLAALAERRADEAYDCLKRALESSLEHAALLKHFAPLAETLDRVEDALPVIERYADFYPGNAELACTCAALRLRQGDLAAARERLDTVLLLEPEHARARELLREIEDRDTG
ncbi:MAG TPA: glycosyltransferase [Candidatus Hydrogenedentes bacterium]|nr:glycosyltransferase [Candidatus Hydrogenedentota bacterium]